MSAALDGPRIPAAAGRTSQLVVFLHGYGADGADLIELGRQWRALMPEAAFVSPHAPERCPASPMGRQWFALSNRPPDDPAGAADRWNGAVKARGAIDAFLDAELKRLSLDESRLALVGFSQGSMMAMHVGLRRPSAPAAILAFSGAAGRPGAPERGDGARCARRAAAHPPHPRRSGSAHPVRSDVHGRRGAGRRFDPGPVASVARGRPRHRRRGLAPRRPVPRRGVRQKEAVRAPSRREMGRRKSKARAINTARGEARRILPA